MVMRVTVHRAASDAPSAIDQHADASAPPRSDRDRSRLNRKSERLSTANFLARGEVGEFRVLTAPRTPRVWRLQVTTDRARAQCEKSPNSARTRAMLERLDTLRASDRLILGDRHPTSVDLACGRTRSDSYQIHRDKRPS
jgi:hypothetical protein